MHRIHWYMSIRVYLRLCIFVCVLVVFIYKKKLRENPTWTVFLSAFALFSQPLGRMGTIPPSYQRLNIQKKLHRNVSSEVIDT